MFAPLTSRFGQLSPHTNTEPCRGGERPPGFMGMSVNLMCMNIQNLGEDSDSELI